MARVVNSFALLDDEEGEDVSLLVENFAKKVDVDLPPAALEKKPPAMSQAKGLQGDAKAPRLAPTEYVRSDRGRGRGGRGRGSGRGGFGGNDSENFGGSENGYRRSYGDGSNGNGQEFYRGRGQGRGGGRGRGRGRGFNNENFRDEKDVSGGNLSNVEDAADGWEQVPQTHARGYGNDVNTNRDEERFFRNGNRNYGGERRGYGSGNRGFRGRRDGQNYGRGEQSTNEELKENAGGADANEANSVADIAIAEGDAAAVTEEPKDVGAEEKTPEEAPKDVTPPAKKEEDEDEKLMTLEEYEKLLAEKRKALEALKKIEERKVTADKDFEAMQLLEKKKEEDVLQKSEAAKLKKKESLEKDDKSRKRVSINEFLKPAEGEEFSYRRPGRGGRGRGGGRGGARSGDFRNEDRGPSYYPRGGGGRGGRDTPMIHIEDQGQFPVLKGPAAVAAPPVEAA